MAGAPKPKSGKTRNDNRSNGKANKQHPGSRGSKGGKLDEGQKVLLGKGLMVKYGKMSAKAKLEGKARARKPRRQESGS